MDLINKIVYSWISKATTAANSQNRLEYILPISEFEHFCNLFQELEKLDSIRLSLEYSSLEDAYLNISELSKSNVKENEFPSESMQLNCSST